MKILPNEQKIVGRWLIEDGKLVADSNAARIDALITGPLREVARSDDGWSVLYIDEGDGRYWELSYPESELHGGGPPLLEVISSDAVNERYTAIKNNNSGI